MIFKADWHDVLLTPAQFYLGTGYQQWFLARAFLNLSPEDGWRWSVVDDRLMVEAVAGDPGKPFPEPTSLQHSQDEGPHAGWDGVEWPA